MQSTPFFFVGIKLPIHSVFVSNPKCNLSLIIYLCRFHHQIMQQIRFSDFVHSAVLLSRLRLTPPSLPFPVPSSPRAFNLPQIAHLKHVQWQFPAYWWSFPGILTEERSLYCAPPLDETSSQWGMVCWAAAPNIYWLGSPPSTTQGVPGN